MGKSLKLFCLLVLGTLNVSLFASPEIKEVRKTVSLTPHGRVSINTYKGSLNFTTWENPQVEIYARIEPDGACANEKELVQDTEIQIEASADSVHIKSDYEKVKRRSFGFLGLFDANCSSLPFVHYSVKMPPTAQLYIKDYKSKIDVATLQSAVEINTYKGSVTLSGLDGSLDLETYKGDARVEFANLASKSRFETYKGTINIVMPKNSGFDLDSDLGRRGSLDSNFDLNMIVRKLSGRKERYRGSINGGGPVLYLKTYKGSFRLRQS